MQLIDANVILRYLLKDSPQMSEKAGEIISEAEFIPSSSVRISSI